MNKLPTLAAVVALATAASLTPSLAHADIDDWTAVPEYTSSPEHFGLEIGVGIFTPLGLGDAFSGGAYFGSDVGPELTASVHYFPWRIEYLGLIGAGLRFGWSQWDTETPNNMMTQRNWFEVFTPGLHLVWRIDSLDYYLDIPVVLTPKIGFDFFVWQTGVGSRTEAAGFAIGPRFAGRVSLVLDFLEPRAARQLDDEWGINHSEIFFEAYYSMAGELSDNQLPLSGWGWTAGLGFTF